MATKPAKTLTINSTKYTLANTLAVANGKIQLKAGDVVLSEIDIPTPTPPPSAIKLMAVGLNDGHGGNYGTAEVLDYSDVFTGTGAGVEINEEKIATGTVPVIYLVEDSTDVPTYSRGYPKSLCPIRFAVKLLGEVNLNFLGVDLYDALSKAIAEYTAHPNNYNRISIQADYFADKFNQQDGGYYVTESVDNIVEVGITFNVTNGTVTHSSASARLLNTEWT